jgi:malonate-semialdehyde dehydrogenase (acetylating)/methylmalonate-semialdehyde dehydrogenase
MIGVAMPMPMAFHSFGGWKRSLFGNMAVHGMEGVRFYTRLKTMTARWPTGVRAGTEYVMPTLRQTTRQPLSAVRLISAWRNPDTAA